MAKLLNCVIVLLHMITLIATPSVYALKHDGSWFQNIRQGNKNFAKIHFYIHDQQSVQNITAYMVAQSSITPTSLTNFGITVNLDDLVTAKPGINSQALGRVQGTVASTDLQTPAITVNLVFYFTVGKFNGSTIAVLGRNPLLNAQRELAVVGGTGVFCMARGYVITRTHSFDLATRNGVFEYTLYVTCDCRAAIGRLMNYQCGEHS